MGDPNQIIPDNLYTVEASANSTNSSKPFSIAISTATCDSGDIAIDGTHLIAGSAIPGFDKLLQIFFGINRFT